MSKSISVVLPAYNEAENLPDGVRAIDGYLSTRFRDYEIIVSNDGSKDNTIEVITNLQKHVPNLRLVNAEKNGGYGCALRLGLQNANKDLVFFTDADLQFDINDLDKLLPLAEQYDIVAGYKIKRRDPLMRIWMSWLYNFTLRLLFHLKIKDINCAFKVFNKKVLENFHWSNYITTGVINAEILAKSLRKGMTVTQIGVNHHPRVKGTTINEVGKRGKILAFVKMRVIKALIRESLKLWKELRS